MKYSSIALALLFLFGVQCIPEIKPEESVELQQLDSLLTHLADSSDHDLFKVHLESISMILNAEKGISNQETATLIALKDAFENDTLSNPSDLQSYLSRERIMILSWRSPSDDEVSFSWMKPPKDYDPENEYPLYVYLHGLWDVADEPINYMSYPFLSELNITTAFEDGFFLSPWGRGNMWYEGQSKTDIWESIAKLETIVNIDQGRKYLSGHSMGGYGTWLIAQESVDEWAAIGLHSAALQYRDQKYVTSEYAQKFKEVPTYIVYGDQETWMAPIHKNVFAMLKEAGNEDVKMVTFEGGHDWNNADVEAMYEWMKGFKNE